MRLSTDGTNYFINTCEWGNGSHVLFATVAASTAVDGPTASFGLAGHAVSSFVGVTFSNLITRISFSEQFFQPSLGQTQQVSAVFAANVNWTLQIRDVSSNLVRTATGSGTSMVFNWDGTGNGGASLPAGVYYHYLSAQANGQPSTPASAPGLGGESASALLLLNAASTVAEPESAQASYPTSAREALAAGLTSYFLPPIPMPPVRMKTNGVWTYLPYEAVYGPQSPIEVAIPLRMQEKFLQSLSTGSAVNIGRASLMNTPSGSGYGGASAQTAPPAPLRKPTAPCANTVGTFGIACQMYNANGTNPIYASPIPNGTGIPGSYVQIANPYGLGANASLPFAPFQKIDEVANNFLMEMEKGCWKVGYFRHDDALTLSSLQGSGTPFNTVDIGLLILHGAYGTSFDFSTGHQFKGIYFPIAAGGGAQYLRMPEMSLGGSSPTNGLKWMALMACTSLYQANWTSMINQNAKPYNGNLHMILGSQTDMAADPLIGQYWADYMLGDPNQKPKPRDPMTIRDAWYLAARQAYAFGYTHGVANYPNPITLAVYADPNCMGDTLQTNSLPIGGTWQRDSQIVFP